jgi:hypothetical protein
MNREPRHFAALGDSRFYWRGELADPPVLQLPTDFPRWFAPSKEAESQDFLLPAELVAPLRDLARGEQTTLFPVLLVLKEEKSQAFVRSEW